MTWNHKYVVNQKCSVNKEFLNQLPNEIREKIETNTRTYSCWKNNILRNSKCHEKLICN